MLSHDPPTIELLGAQTAPVSAVQLSLLNGFRLQYGGDPVSLPPSTQRLVAFLALHQHPILRPHVAGQLWLDSTEDRAHGNLRSALWRLRQVGFPLLHTTSTHLALAGDVAVDARQLVQNAHRLISGQLDDLLSAPSASLFMGQLLPDWYDDWIVLERERIRQLCLHALEQLCRRLAAGQHYAMAVEAGLAAVCWEPLRESAQRALIEAHLSEGNPSEALRQYQRYERVLGEELGMEPTRELRNLVCAGGRSAWKYGLFQHGCG